jgi:hypothetical protein
VDSWDFDHAKWEAEKQVKRIERRGRCLGSMMYRFFLQIVRPGESWDEVIARFRDIIVHDVVFSGRLDNYYGLRECYPGQAQERIKHQSNLAMNWIMEMELVYKVPRTGKEESLRYVEALPDEQDINVDALKQELYHVLDTVIARQEDDAAKVQPSWSSWWTSSPVTSWKYGWTSATIF